MSRPLLQATAAIGTLCIASLASAGAITGWDDGNVLTIQGAAGDGVSIIYDGPAAQAGTTSHGRMVFDGSEAVAPGLKIVNEAPPSVPPTPGNVDNCLMASSAASCNSERQSGKRFKLDQTSAGAIDLVFDHDPSGGLSAANDGRYKVYQKYGNATGGPLTGFTVTLGGGVGSGFSASAAGDGLRFVDFGSSPSNSQFSALFANGLFGPVDEEHPLTGYFSPERAGFGLVTSGEDSFRSTGIFGSYAALFGDWMAYGQAPTGLFFDEDGDASTDALLVAHRLADGSWVQNRGIGADGSVVTIAYGDDGTAFTDLDLLLAALPPGLVSCADALPGQACVAGQGVIEDLGKFNLTFSIDPGSYADSEFTLRVTAVPEPSTYAMLAMGLLVAGAARHRQSRRT